MLKLSPTAFKLYRLLTQRPGRYTLGEAKRDLNASKTKFEQALNELEDQKIISVEVKE